MENHSLANSGVSQNATQTSPCPDLKQPTEYDKLITDVLKHLTTLNTGLLAVIAVFNRDLLPVFRLNLEYTTYFFLTFYLSLVLSIWGLVSTIFVLRQKELHIPTYKRKGKRTHPFAHVREVIIFIAAILYIISLMYLLALFSYGYQVLPIS